MVSWQENASDMWPHRRPRPSMPMGLPARDQDLDATEVPHDTGDSAGQIGAPLAPAGQSTDQDDADRLTADQLLIQAIVDEGLHRGLHQAFEEQLIRYAVPVLRHLLAEGGIVSRAAQLGRPPKDSGAWLEFRNDEREEFARDMVAKALPMFTEAVFEVRHWSPARGASLKTYFVNACILQFPALYKKWLRQRAVQPYGLYLVSSASATEMDPATMVALRDEVSRLLDQIKDPQLRKVLVLRGVGYTAEEAAQMAGLTTKAAENRLARFRRRLRNTRDSTETPGTRRRNISERGRWAQ